MLQTRTVEPRTLELLKSLMSESYLSNFNLVGGTALALQLGHRMSIDLDFFTNQKFEIESLLHTLQKKYHLKVILQTDSMLITNINNIKVDFVKMGYPTIYPINVVEGVRMLDIRDIAAMKLKAIVQRGSKKDFFDIYFLLELFSIDEIIELFKQKFKQYEIFHIIKSLCYFKDAEEYADPIVFDKKITWELIKSYIQETVQKSNYF